VVEKEKGREKRWRAVWRLFFCYQVLRKGGKKGSNRKRTREKER